METSPLGRVTVKVEPLPSALRAAMVPSHAGPTLTYDDLLDLHLLLEAPDWWSRLVDACQ